MKTEKELNSQWEFTIGKIMDTTPTYSDDSKEAKEHRIHANIKQLVSRSYDLLDERISKVSNGRYRIQIGDGDYETRYPYLIDTENRKVMTQISGYGNAFKDCEYILHFLDRIYR